MARKLTYIPNRVIDTNGISDGASIHVYATGTTTPVSIYSDESLTTPLANPYVVPAGAAVPEIYHNESGSIRVRIVENGGAVISDDDPFKAPVTDADLASTDAGKGAAWVGVQGGGTVQGHVDYVIDPLNRVGGGSTKSLVAAFHNFPATTAGADDAPNVVVGTASGTDLPSTTFGNFVWTPRDNDASAGVGYRNRLGANVTYSFIAGGDNDFNALAVFAIGHHHRADATGGGAPTHPMLIGSFNVVTSAYGVAIGTLSNIHGTKAVGVGSGSTIGVEGSTEASRESAFIGGQNNNITGRNTFIGAGLGITASGNYAAAFGRATKASHDYSVASGYFGTTLDKGERVHSPGPFNTSTTTGDNIDSRLNLYRTITGSSPTQLLTDGTSSSITVPGANSSHALDGIVHVVRIDGGANQEALYEIKALISNMSGAITLVYQNVTALHEDDAAWNCDVSLSGSTYQIRVTGASGVTVRAAARIHRSVIRNV